MCVLFKRRKKKKLFLFLFPTQVNRVRSGKHPGPRQRLQLALFCFEMLLYDVAYGQTVGRGFLEVGCGKT